MATNQCYGSCCCCGWHLCLYIKSIVQRYIQSKQDNSRARSVCFCLDFKLVRSLFSSSEGVQSTLHMHIIIHTVFTLEKSVASLFPCIVHFRMHRRELQFCIKCNCICLWWKKLVFRAKMSSLNIDIKLKESKKKIRAIKKQCNNRWTNVSGKKEATSWQCLYFCFGQDVVVINNQTPKWAK